MTATTIPFSSLYTNDPIELFWVIFNSILPICREYTQYIGTVILALLALISWANWRRTQKLEKDKNKLKKEIKRGQSPHR